MDFDFQTVQNLGLLILVGIIWGVTNPFMEKGTKTENKSTEQQNNQDFGWKSFIRTITNFKFFIPFLLNQSGSLLYYFLLGRISNIFWCFQC